MFFNLTCQLFANNLKFIDHVFGEHMNDVQHIFDLYNINYFDVYICKLQKMCWKLQIW